MKTGKAKAGRVAIERLLDVRNREVILALVETFEVAASAGLRNRLALALADADDERAKNALVKALGEERTRGNRGTLLYALRHYDCGDLLPLLVKSITEGSYEEAQHALDILERTEADLTEAEFGALVTQLKGAAEGSKGWRRDAINLCLELFQAVKSSHEVF